MKIGIVGYGNLGKAVEKVASLNKDIRIVGIFSRRKVESTNPTYTIEEAKNFKGKIDVMFMCSGSERDLATQTPEIAKMFNVIDSFDTHAKIPEHLEKVGKACKTANTSAIVCCGWDPGLFSVMRAIYSSIFDYTECFWGKGISLGHSNAVRKVDGVIDAKQYTVPNHKAVALAKKGLPINVAKHFRECYVVANEKKAEIEQSIKKIPNYFLGQPTSVKFISQKELDTKHNSLAHQGNIYSYSNIDSDAFSSHFELSMTSNPLLTAKILLAYANAILKMQKFNIYSALTPLEVPPVWLHDLSVKELTKTLC